jgi:hypothetical protein
MEETKEVATSPLQRLVMRVVSRLTDRYLWAWKLWRLWRDKKYIIESKMLNIKMKYLIWRIERAIKKGRNA